MAYPIIWPQSTTLYQTDANQGQKAGFLNPFLDALDGSYCTYSAFGETGNDPVNDPVYPDPSGSGFQGKLQCGIYKPANVISVSYGETEDQLPPSYQQRQCNEFMKLGLQGVSVLFASGDSGVAGRDSTSSNICLGPNNKIFNPGYPVNCPFITTVGATVLPAGTSTNGSETAVVRFGSGGGFSNIYPQPDYQKAALATYFANHDPGYKSYNGNASFGANGGIYNRIGRAYPDVAASGDNGAIFVAGKSSLIGGTSMSSPIFGAILNRINEERIAAGKSTVGFVNPTLYANPSVLNDVTAGDNSAGGACGTKGFAAVTGWDPVTGLGTPNYPKMLALFLGLK